MLVCQQINICTTASVGVKCGTVFISFYFAILCIYNVPPSDSKSTPHHFSAHCPKAHRHARSGPTPASHSHTSQSAVPGSHTYSISFISPFSSILAFHAWVVLRPASCHTATAHKHARGMHLTEITDTFRQKRHSCFESSLIKQVLPILVARSF